MKNKGDEKGFAPFICFAAFLMFISISSHVLASGSGVSVFVSPAFFNPSENQKATISIQMKEAATATVLIVDRDGFPVRMIAKEQPLHAGVNTMYWDGRYDGNSSAKVVPDENYSLKINFKTKHTTWEYFPANSAPKDFTVTARYYDRKNHIIAFDLPFASRVHMQAGCAVEDSKTHEMTGPVLRTLLNREPRAAGANVVEFDGADQNSLVQIGDLPHFVLSIAATELPQNSITTLGNRSQTFLDSLAERRGASLFTYKVAKPHHHIGLSSIQDAAPDLRLKIDNGTQTDQAGRWQLSAGQPAKISFWLEGVSKDAFAAEPGLVRFFVDQKLVSQTNAPSKSVEISSTHLPVGKHLVTINWGTTGPATVNSAIIEVSNQQARNAERGKKHASQ